MEIKEDLEFKFQDSEKIIHANEDTQYFFLHPKFYEQEKDKVIRSSNGIRITGNPQNKELIVIESLNPSERVFYKYGRIRVFDSNFKESNDKKYNTFNGKVLYYLDSKNDTYTFIDCKKNIIIENMKERQSYGAIHVYDDLENKRAIIISSTGAYYIINDLDKTNYYIEPDIFYILKNDRENGYFISEIYNKYGYLIGAKNTSWTKEEIEIIKNNNKMEVKEDNKLKLMVYEQFLTSRIKYYLKSLDHKLPKKYLLQMSSIFALNHKLNLVIDLESYEVYSGLFKECYQIKVENNSIWLKNPEKLDELQESISSYQRKRVLK